MIAHHCPHAFCRRGPWWLCVSGSLLVSLFLAVSQAQISLDGSLGPRGALTGPDYAIPAAVGQIRGGNLFHSFGQFTIRTGESATFTGPDTIANILSRVTGGMRSDIDGTLRSTIDGANLFLLNPAGVLFGPNARLDVRGSFHVSTADFLRFQDGAEFHADLGKASVLTVAPVETFGFLHENPAGITIDRSVLEAPAGKTISVIGGDVRIAGDFDLPTFSGNPTLSAPSGRINLASITSPGDVRLTTTDRGPSLNVNNVRRLGEISLLPGTLIDVSGPRGGTVVIRGGRLMVENASIFADTEGNMHGAPIGIDVQMTEDVVLTGDVGVSAQTLFGRGNAGDVVVAAKNVSITGGAQIASSTFVGPGRGGTITITATEAVTLAGTNPGGDFPSGLFAQSLGTGDAGAVVVEARTVTLTGGGLIFTSNRGRGHGGPITVRATDAVTIHGTQPNGLGSGLVAQAAGTREGVGKAGDIVVEARTVAVTGGAQVGSSTFGPGHGGTVTVRATDTVLLDGTTPAETFPSGLFANAQGRGRTAGNAGNVVVEATTLTITGGAQVTSGTFGPGHGGTITVRATGTVTLDGTSPTGALGSGLFTNAEGRGETAGNAGNVVVEAQSVTITGGATISSATFGPGQGGTLTITATDAVSLAGRSKDGRFPSSLSANARGMGAEAGDAGDIVVAAKTVELTQGALIRTSAEQARGRAGDILLEAGSITIRAGARVDSRTLGPGAGGVVTVRATEALTLEGTDPVTGLPGGIFTDTQGQDAGAGAAGTLRVEAGSIAVRGGAQISSSTLGPGHGGNVMVQATETLTVKGTGPGTGTVSGIFVNAMGTEAGAGAAGSIVVTAPRVTLTDGGTIDSSTFGPGQGGNVMVQAIETLTVAGTTPNGALPSGIFVRAMGTEAGAGNAGAVQVAAGSVTVRGGAQISGSTLGPGQGGTVTVTATDTVVIAGAQSGLSTTAQGSGRGGDILLQAPILTLSDGASITAESTGPADAGTIRLTATERFLSEHSTVTTAARLADGGNIQVTAQALVRLRDSSITATVGGGAETVGGNITIDPEFVVLEGSQILAEAFQGKGGNISITAGVVLADPASRISASSTLGVAGTVDIRAPVTNLSGTVAALPQTFQQAAALLRHRCAERWWGSPVSSFVLGGRDSIPATPGGVLPSPLYEAPLGTAGTGKTRVPEAVRSRPSATLLRLDTPGQFQVRSAYAQRFLQRVLDMECAR